jgi:hypothetical protein
VIRDWLGNSVTHHKSRFRPMFNFRFLIYCVLAYLAFRFVRRLLTPASGVGPGGNTRKSAAAQMIRCENCGMFITQSSALLVSGREFCSKSCAQKVNRV